MNKVHTIQLVNIDLGKVKTPEDAWLLVKIMESYGGSVTVCRNAHPEIEHLFED